MPVIVTPGNRSPKMVAIARNVVPVVNMSSKMPRAGNRFIEFHIVDELLNSGPLVRFVSTGAGGPIPNHQADVCRGAGRHLDFSDDLLNSIIVVRMVNGFG